jgi:hypothetical protein
MTGTHHRPEMTATKAITSNVQRFPRGFAIPSGTAFSQSLSRRPEIRRVWLPKKPPCNDLRKYLIRRERIFDNFGRTRGDGADCAGLAAKVTRCLTKLVLNGPATAGMVGVPCIPSGMAAGERHGFRRAQRYRLCCPANFVRTFVPLSRLSFENKKKGLNPMTVNHPNTMAPFPLAFQHVPTPIRFLHSEELTCFALLTTMVIDADHRYGFAVIEAHRREFYPAMRSGMDFEE